VKRRDESLLDQVEADIASDAPLGQVLRKCVLLGGRAGSADVREWASRELKGYDGVDLGIVPAHRKVSAVIQADAVVGNYQVRGQQISPMQLPDFTRGAIDESVTLCSGVRELEALLRTAFDNNGACLSLPSGSDLALYMNHEADDPYQHIERLYWRLSPVAIQGVLDQIRTSLTELVAELRAGMRADEALPSADLADQALSVAIHGKGARVTVNAAMTNGGGSSSATPSAAYGFWTPWKKFGAFAAGLASVGGLALAVGQWQHWLPM